MAKPKRTRVLIVSYILLIVVVVITSLLASFIYNSERFRDDPSLLGVPTITFSIVTPVFVVVARTDFTFDSGLNEPLAVGTPQFELGD